MACRLAGANPLSEPMLEYFNWTLVNKLQLGNKLQWNLNRNSHISIQENTSEKWRPFCLGLNVLMKCNQCCSYNYYLVNNWKAWHDVSGLKSRWCFASIVCNTLNVHWILADIILIDSPTSQMKRMHSFLSINKQQLYTYILRISMTSVIIQVRYFAEMIWSWLFSYFLSIWVLILWINIWYLDTRNPCV